MYFSSFVYSQVRSTFPEILKSSSLGDLAHKTFPSLFKFKSVHRAEGGGAYLAEYMDLGYKFFVLFLIHTPRRMVISLLNRYTTPLDHHSSKMALFTFYTISVGHKSSSSGLASVKCKPNECAELNRGAPHLRFGNQAEDPCTNKSWSCALRLTASCPRRPTAATRHWPNDMDISEYFCPGRKVGRLRRVLVLATSKLRASSALQVSLQNAVCRCSKSQKPKAKSQKKKRRKGS